MAKHSVSSYRATGMLSRFQAGCDICVCVCVRAIASQRKGIPESTTRVCVVPGLRFAGGGAANKKRASFIRAFGSEGGGVRSGEDLKNKIRRNYPGHCFGAGGGENKARAAFVRVSLAQEGGALNTCINK